MKIKKIYLVLFVIIIIVIIGIFSFQQSGQIKNKNILELKGEIVFPASPVMLEGFNCVGFRPEGIIDPEIYLQRWDIKGNYITICSKQVINYNEFENKEVIVKGPLQKASDGRGYIITDVIEKVK